MFEMERSQGKEPQVVTLGPDKAPDLRRNGGDICDEEEKLKLSPPPKAAQKQKHAKGTPSTAT